MLRLLLFSSLFCIFLSANAQQLDTTMWVTDGGVGTLARQGNTLYVGGNFTYIGPNTGNGAIIAPDGTVLPGGLSRINGRVSGSVSDGKGGWFISGLRIAADGTESYFLRHLLPGGKPDPNWNVTLNGPVGSMTVVGNLLYASGGFLLVNGQPREYVAALNAATGAVTPWHPVASGGVHKLLVSGDTVYIGGTFDRMNNQTCRGLAAVHARTGELLPWYPNIASPYDLTGTGIVYTMVLKGRVLYVGGDFYQVGGQNRRSLAAINTQTALPEPWAPVIDDVVYALAMVGNTVYIGGNFSTVGGQPRKYLAAVDASTGQFTPWSPNPNGDVYALGASNNILYAGGYFTTMGLEPRRRLAAIGIATGQVTPWNPGTNERVTTLAVSGDTVYAGGEFSSIGGASRAYAAAFDVSTKALTAWNPRPNGPVRSLILQNNTVYLAGSFGLVGNAERGNLAAVDATTGAPYAWNPRTDQGVFSCRLLNNKLYLLGPFSTVNGQPRRFVAALDVHTGALTDWNPAPDSYVLDLATDGSRVFLAGGFTAVGGQSRKILAAVDAVTGQATAWNPVLTGSAQTLLLSGSTLYVGGTFTLTDNGRSRNMLVAFHTGTGRVTPWNPVLTNSLTPGDSVLGSVQALALSGRTLYAGGPFLTAGGQVRKGVAALDTATAIATPWNPAVTGGTVGAILPTGDALYLSGNFTRIDNKSTVNLAAMPLQEPPPPRYNTIGGSVFDDKNRDCTSNDGQAGLPNVVVVAEPGSYYASTDSLGRYTLSADTGTYTVKQLLTEEKTRLIDAVCPPARTVALKTYGNDLTGQDFGVQIAPCAALNVQVASFRRRCAAGYTTVRYCNAGGLPAAGAKVYLKLPEYVVLVNADRAFTRDKDQHYVFDVGTLAPGQCGTLSVTDSVVCNDPGIRGLTQCTRAWITPANRCAEPSPDWDRSDIVLGAKCLENGVARLTLRNAGSGDMADSAQFRVRLDAQLAFTHRFKLAAGDSLILRVPAQGQTVRLEADQRPAHPTKQATSVTLEACGTNGSGQVSTGFVTRFPPDDEEPEVAEDCQPVLDGSAPSDLVTLPAGTTDQHYTPTEARLQYTIRFQNTGTAPVRQVVVTDTLSEHLDVSTLQTGVASHTYRLQVSGAGKPVLTFTFDHINLPNRTTDPLGSNGYVQFSIKPQGDTPPKTRVENTAEIFFDLHPPVRTTTVFNTVYDVPAEAFPPSPLKAATVIATPTLTRFTPAAGQAGTTVVITGTHFDPVPARNAVAFNGITAAVTQATDSTLTVQVPAGEATGKITVVTPDGTAVSATDFALIPTPTPTPGPAPTPVPTALAPGLQRETIQIHPNPAPGRFVIAFTAPMPPVRGIAVYNALGACVLRMPVTNPFLTHQAIRLPGHGPGMFVVVVATDGGLVTRKVTLK